MPSIVSMRSLCASAPSTRYEETSRLPRITLPAPQSPVPQLYAFCQELPGYNFAES